MGYSPKDQRKSPVLADRASKVKRPTDVATQFLSSLDCRRLAAFSWFRSFFQRTYEIIFGQSTFAINECGGILIYVCDTFVPIYISFF
jgi:hypothetical protein